MTWVLAVCDRTGRLHDLLTGVYAEDDVEVLSIPHGPALADDEGDADVLVLGAKELTSAGLKRVASWVERHPDASAVAHLDPATASRWSEDALRDAGIVHWVAAATGELPGALTAVLDELALPGSLRPRAEREASSSKPDNGDPDVELHLVRTGPDSGPSFGGEDDLLAEGPKADVAYVITVCSASGGSGKTFYAANLATYVADLGHRALLIDLDLQFGEVGAALQIRHPYSLYDGLYDASGQPLPGDSLDRHLHELVYRSDLGFDVLLAPRDPIIGENITAEDVELVIAVTTLQYDVVIVDTPPALTETVLSVLDRSDVVTVLSTLDVPSLRNLTSFLEVLKRIEVGRDRVRLMLNKVESDIGIDVAQAQEAFGGAFIATLPANKSASRSINTGTVLLRAEPKSPLARALIASMRAVLPAELLPAPADAGAPSASADAPTLLPKGLRGLLNLRRPAPGGSK